MTLDDALARIAQLETALMMLDTMECKCARLVRSGIVEHRRRISYGSYEPWRPLGTLDNSLALITKHVAKELGADPQLIEDDGVYPPIWTDALGTQYRNIVGVPR